MNKMFKKLTTLLLAGALCIGMASTAFAADTQIIYKGKENDKGIFSFRIPDFITYEELPNSEEYTVSDLFDNFKNVMPGDVLTQPIKIKNESGSEVTLSMSSRPHNDQNEEQYDNLHPKVDDHVISETVDDSGNTTTVTEDIDSVEKFLAKLGLKIYDQDPEINPNAKLMYSGTAKELTTSVSIGTIAKNSSTDIYVQLAVPHDLGNTDANRVGEVDWVFTVSENSGGNPPSGGGDDDGGDDVKIRKYWNDNNNPDRPDSITVKLTPSHKNNSTGKLPDPVIITLYESNGWKATKPLDSDYQWTVEEINIPEGYGEPIYYIGSNKIEITNNLSDDSNKDPNPGNNPGGGDDDSPVFTADLTVVKAWDDDNSANRPDRVTLQLYNGTTVADTITLSAADGWTYTWEDLAADGEWRVIEVDIPDGYTPIYSMVDGVVTITNTESLIETGQMNWPIPVLGGLGVLVLASGIVLMRRKKDHAAE